MNKGLKILLGLVVFLVIVIGATFFIISSKIKPDEIKKLMVDAISKSLPGTDVFIGEVDYSLGTSIKIKIDDLKLNLKKDKSKLFDVKKIEANIPILSILSGGGTIDLNINNPNAYYTEVTSLKNNWTLALPETHKNVEDKNEKLPTKSTEFEIPKFVEDSKINVRINDINLTYSPYQKKVSKIIVNKISFKNINLKSSTAFEVASIIDYQLNAKSNLKTQLKIVGEVNVGKFLKENSLEATIMADISNTNISNLPLKIPNLENKIKLNINKNGVIGADLKVKASNIFDISTKVSLTNQKLNATDIDVSLNLQNTSNILGNDLKDLLNKVDISDSILKIKGKTEINLDKLSINPNLSIEVKKPIKISVVEGIPINATFNASINSKSVEINLVNELLNGIVTSKVKTNFDPLNIPSELKNFAPIYINVLATNLKLSKGFLQKTLYENKTKQDDQKVLGTTQPVQANRIVLPNVFINFEGKNIFVDDQEVKVSSNIKVFENKVNGNKLDINFGSGLVKSPFNVVINDSQNFKTNFDMKMQNIDFSSFTALLPPIVNNVKGNFSGTVVGDLNLLAKGLEYNLSIDVKATNGELKDFQLKKLITSLFDGIKDKFPKKAEVVTNRFESLSAKLRANEKVNQISNFNFIGDKQSFDLKLKGNLYMINKESVLTGSLKEIKTSKELKNQTGLDYYPLKFSGQGMVLINPHPEYTIQILGGSMAKVQTQKAVKKETKKFEKKAKKELEKFLKGVKF